MSKEVGEAIELLAHSIVSYDAGQAPDLYGSIKYGFGELADAINDAPISEMTNAIFAVANSIENLAEAIREKELK